MATIRDYQIRVNSLNILPVSLVVDGQNGPNTRRGIALAMNFLGVQDQDEILDNSGLYRIHWHWTASTYMVTPKMLSHYNAVFDINGKYYPSVDPTEQARYSHINDVGVSHTRMANTHAIGLAVAACGLRKANWHNNTVTIGKYPMSWKQIDAMLKRTAYYCKKFDIRVSKWTTLTHAEIQPTLGIKQNGKWDIRCFPDDKRLWGAVEAGDYLRKRMVEKFL